MNIQTLKSRSLIVKLIRRFFDERDFLEMHTPRLVGLPGQEPYLEPFWTNVIEANGTSHPAGLITSPEYMMKRLLAAGMERIYDLGPCFRNNEPWDGTHDPEFLLLEWYRRDTELDALMDETEEMVKWVWGQYSEQCTGHSEQCAVSSAQDCLPTVAPNCPLPTAHRALSQNPFRRLTVEQAWKEYAGIDLAPLLGNREAMAEACLAHNQTVTETDTWDDLYYKIFLSEIELKIANGEPTFLYRYPLSMAALARPSKDDARWADRVELYIGGMELANGFAELSDEDVQRKRFEEERALRGSLGKPTWPLDEPFLSCLPQMGNAAGIAFGVDRLVMLLTGSKSINDVIPSSARERFTV